MVFDFCLSESVEWSLIFAEVTQKKFEDSRTLRTLFLGLYLIFFYCGFLHTLFCWIHVVSTEKSFTKPTKLLAWKTPIFVVSVAWIIIVTISAYIGFLSDPELVENVGWYLKWVGMIHASVVIIPFCCTVGFIVYGKRLIHIMRNLQGVEENYSKKISILTGIYIVVLDLHILNLATLFVNNVTPLFQLAHNSIFDFIPQYILISSHLWFWNPFKYILTTTPPSSSSEEKKPSRGSATIINTNNATDYHTIPDITITISRNVQLPLENADL